MPALFTERNPAEAGGGVLNTASLSPSHTLLTFAFLQYVLYIRQHVCNIEFENMMATITYCYSNQTIDEAVNAQL
jgi:hypothetical protein